MRSLARLLLAAGLAMQAGLASAQAAPDDLESLRQTTQSKIIAGCVAAFSEDEIRTTLERARASGRADLTEPVVRERVYSKAGPYPCHCVMAASPVELHGARSSQEIQAILDNVESVELPTIAARKDEPMASCVPLAKRAGPPPAESGVRWEKLGHWDDGDRYIDAGSIQELGAGKVKAWFKAVLTEPRPFDDGKLVLSIKLLKVYDCDQGTDGSLGVHAHADRDGQQAVYDSSRSENSIAYHPTASDEISQALRSGACTRRANR